MTNVQKRKVRLYFLVVKNAEGVISQVIENQDYTNLTLEGMDLAKTLAGSWEVFDSQGRYIDGSSTATQKHDNALHP